MAITGALAAGATWAQQSAEQGANQPALMEIIVTAQKREQNIQDVPISVIALSAQQLQDAGRQRHQELAGVDTGPDRYFHHL